VNSFLAVSLILAKNFRLYGYFPVTRINRDTGKKFFAGVVDTAEQFISVIVIDTGDKYSFANISENFRKIQNGPNGILGAWGTLIHEKT
jgi:hypothetical protein